MRYANGDEVGYVMTVYEARLVGRDAQPDGSETLDVRFCAPDEIADLEAARWLPVVLEDVFAERK